MRISEESMSEMFRHALDTYPDECCGVVTGSGSDQTVHRCENIQNTLHRKDPENHPRDARTAYAIDRKELDAVFSTAEANNEKIVGFYHSHVEHDAYFSDMDRDVQRVFGEPEFPEALHVVISVRDRKISGLKCFAWDGDRKDFVTVEM